MEDRMEKGYTKEEEYFYNLNKELIDKKRRALDGKRKEQRSRELQEQHWMRCPKCGQQMEEEELAGIMVDRCTGCSGMYFDKGELEILLSSKEPKGFLTGLKKWFA
ncbi:MAG: zf-TFIIB domain-containing protein [Deltaproteobacteria bacterium]|nr:zf-TFIIB domain-containing protein [Deltaproteobacteria bacterium]